MFILRQINREGLESNLFLGKRFAITYRERHQKRFTELLGKTVTHPDQEKVYAIITFDGSSDAYPLYEEQQYYIMTESGQTFNNVTFR